jgi:RNA-directed DNA polymerase
MPRFGWTKIVRHSLVLGAASPDDPVLTDYWARRRGKNPPLLDRSILILLAKQHGRCALCQGLLLHADHEPRSPTESEQWHRVTRKAITKHHVTAHADKATPDDTPPRSLTLPAPGIRRPQRPSTPLRLKRHPGLA